MGGTVARAWLRVGFGGSAMGLSARRFTPAFYPPV
jgi:hypothetical protein